MKESWLLAYELSPPRHHRHQQADTAPARQLPDPVLRPPVPSSARPHVQVQQYGRHDEEEEHSAHPTTRPLSPPSQLPDLPVSHKEAFLPPARPAQPPRRIVPQAPEEQELEEEEEEEEEEATDDEGLRRLVPPHLFARSVQPGGPILQHPVRRGAQRYEADEDEDGSDNDAPALPVLQRRSTEVRSLPPPLPPPAAPPQLHLYHHRLSAPPSDISEPDSDHDGQALPVRPRHIAAPPTPLQAPPATPRRSVPSVPANQESFLSYGMPSVAVSQPETGTEEVLDEEEGGKVSFSVPGYYTNPCSIF